MNGADQVRVSTFVRISPEDAFAVFTRETDLWWRRGPRYRQGSAKSVIAFFDASLRLSAGKRSLPATFS